MNDILESVSALETHSINFGRHFYNSICNQYEEMLLILLSYTETL